MTTKILITGGSGLLGTHLSALLSASGHEVIHLSRTADPQARFPAYRWDLRSRFIDPKALEGTAHIIHLAGTGIADKRWTSARKREIISSRVDGVMLLADAVEQSGIVLQSFTSASGISFYGMDTGQKVMTESDPAGSDFLAETVVRWEAAADLFQGIARVAKIRIGVVLSDKGGALPVMARPVRFLVGAPLGTGKQLVSWIHIHDLCRLFRFVLDQELAGTYNAVAPNPVTNEELTKAIAKTLHKPLLLPNVPSFAMKALLGEMAEMVLGGNNVSGKRIQSKGFKFEFIEMEESVKDLLAGEKSDRSC